MRLVALVGAIALVACGMPFWRVPPHIPKPMANPPTSPADFDAIGISYSGCLGTCPIYSVELSASGVARYEGVCYVKMLGTYEARVDSATFASAAQLVLDSDFLRIDETMTGIISDADNVEVAIRLVDGRVRRLGYGPSFWGIARQIDLLASHLQWRFVAPPRRRACAT
jgi:hypothetical protein